MRAMLLCLSLALTASPMMADDGPLGLAAPQVITESGLLGHILPRFSLKTGVRVTADKAGRMALSDTPPGVPVFARGGTTYYLRSDDSAAQTRFRDWLTSQIGKRTVESFKPEAGAPFSADVGDVETTRSVAFEGDAALGEKLSLTHCGRCHVIGPRNRMGGMGSTPSFAVLRSLPDWDDRFEQFFVLRPHGAFTQIAGVTPPFDPERPPPIVPVEISLDDLDAILAYVSVTTPADLGAPLHLQ